MINKSLIYNYINTITKNDIVNFGLNQGIQLNDYETNIIYDYIKNKFDDFINNPDNVLIDIKNKLSDNTYQKILELYNKYKIFLDKIK